MNPFQLNLSLSYLFTGLTLLSLSLFVYLKDKTNPINKTFAVYSFCIAWWSLVSISLINATTHAAALIADKICLLTVVFIPSTFLHFILTFCKPSQTHKILIRICYSISFFFLILIFTPLFVKDVSPVYKLKYFSAPGSGYYIFLIFFAITTYYGIWIVYQASTKTKNSIRKQQLSYLFWATLGGYIGGSLNFNLVLRIPPYSIVPWGTYFVGIYGIVLAYVIVKYRFLSINIVVQRGIIYSITITTLSITYLLLVFVLEKFAQAIFRYHSITVSVGTAFALGLVFIPLRHRVQYFMDRYFFKGSADEIAEQNELLRREVAQGEKHKAVATLASGIAHEIRNPLTSLKTFFEYYPKKKNDPAFMAKFNRIATQEFGRIENLVQQLLDFARPSPANFQPTDIHRLIEDTLSLIEGKLHDRKIHLARNLTTDPRPLTTDPNKLKQALLNIFLNAIEAMPNGGNLLISTSLHVSHFTIHVSDTGPGITPEDLKHIFDPFFSRKDGGTGLGLAITQGIIEEHGGTIEVKSTMGKGTEIIIKLPNN